MGKMMNQDRICKRVVFQSIQSFAEFLAHFHSLSNLLELSHAHSCSLIASLIT